MTVERQVKNAAELAKNMQIMAKLTGKDISQMQEDTANRMRDGATQAAIRLMEMDGATNAGKIYSEANTRLQGSSELLRKLTQDAIQKNVPLSQVTAEYASVNAEAFHYIKEFRAAMKAGDEKRALAAIDKAAAAEKAMAVSERGSQIATLGQLSSVGKAQADVLEETGDIITGIQKLTKGLGTAVDSSKTQMDKFTEALKILTGEVDAVALGKAPGQEALKVINTAEKELAEVAGVATETIGKAIDANENFKKLFTGTSRMLEGLSETAESFITKFDNISGSPANNAQILESQLGKTTSTGDTITENDISLYREMINPLTDLATKLENAEILKARGIIGADGIIVDSISNPIISADAKDFEAYLKNPTDDAEQLGRATTMREKIDAFLGRFGGFKATGGYIPVSYTHLRAHET